MTVPAQGMPVTAAQRKVYDAIALFMSANGRAPTRRELCVAAGIKSPGLLQNRLKRLRERGLIDWTANQACSLTIIQRGSGYALPPEVQQRLEAFCANTGERPLGFIADAVMLQLDYAEAHSDEIRVGVPESFTVAL